MAMMLTEIPDHLLAEIFLQLPAPEDLARTSAACVSFRRLVTDRSFLRQFRRIHSPPFLGFLNRDGFHPTQPLSPPFTPAARMLTLTADFSFSFLPSHCRWDVQDIRDGRVLLHRLPEPPERWPAFRELVVCDPLHRRYILIPPLPEDLAPSKDQAPTAHDPIPGPQCNPFLLPLGEEDEATAATGETSFKVICVVHCKIKLSAFVFSSSTEQWTAAASKAWNDLVLNWGGSVLMPQVPPFFLRRYYAYGCFYWDWLRIESKKLLVLDTRKMEFSMADLPPGEWSRQGLAFVEAREGMPGMFGFHRGTPSDLRYTIVRDKSESPSQWQMKRTIPLDSGYTYDIRDATERYLLLTRTETSSLENPLTEYLSMDIKTLKLQRVCAKLGTRMYMDRIYANFPPSLLSSPTI